MKSDVFLAQVQSADLKSRLAALEKILQATQESLEFERDELIPVKMTVGDSTCVYHLSPDFIKAVVGRIKKTKAKPFLFDTNVIYKGQRQNAVDHLALVQQKGYSHTKVGAPYIIADGLLGQDGKGHDIKATHIERVKVPSFVGTLQNLVVLSHATGHVLAGFAGAIKNVAMGMSCRPTKQVEHSSLKPHIIENRCTSCGCCLRICPAEAISWKNERAFVDEAKCVGCGECLCACVFEAIFINWEEETTTLCRRMADVAHFILSKFVKKLFITFAFDMTQECDCISTKNDKMIAPSIGILASEDILSLDKATADLMEASGSPFLAQHPAYQEMFKYGAQIGLGNQDYNLIRL